MRLRGLLVSAILLLLPVVGQAQPIEGFYASLGAGYQFTQRARVTPLSSGFGAAHLRLLENGGPRGLGSIGYALGNGFRFEIEGDFMRNGVRELARTPFPTEPGGHVNRYGVMANALFDMDIGNRYVFPYLGIGAGYMWTNLDAHFTQLGGPFSFSSDDTHGRFAWQA